MKFRKALLGATLLGAAGVGAPGPALGQAVNGLYIGAGAGANFMHDESIRVRSFPAGFPAAQRGRIGPRSLSYDTGFVGLASVGYGFGNGLRVEVEGSYRQNKIDRFGGPTGFQGGGDQHKYTGMVNVLYDFDPALFGLGFLSGILPAPYIGGGGGYSYVQQKNARYFGSGGATVPLLWRTNRGEGAFAYQAIVGTAVPIQAVPGLSLTVEYRFFGLAEKRSYDYQFFAPNVAGRSRLRHSDNFNHSALVGVRYAFNTPQPPPPPVVQAPPPVQQVARTYLVFFDWDRADLTDRARQVIAEAAQATTRAQVTRIEVAGHADRSGLPAYNQELSQRRARNDVAELVRLGVAQSAITVQAFGEDRPLVATDDGVREMQNRRVEIVLR